MSIKEKVLRKYGRAILHMRQQQTNNRFGLVFGAGSSIGLGFPLWKDLINRIAEAPEVDGVDLLKNARDKTSKSQLLYQHYRQKMIKEAGADAHNFNKAEADIRAGWQTIVHRVLYQKVPKSVKKLLKRDLYVAEFLPIVKKTPLTINYNFDDSIQRMLMHLRTPDEKKEERGYSTVWNANIQMFPRKGVVYHPNGFLPFSLQERASEQLIFLEDSFADQLINSMVGHYNALSYHLTQATRLLIGLSLDDPTLKHLLRQNAVLHPGHFHYYISFVREKPVKPDVEECMRNANFETYNLITLFLNADEIKALAQLLDMPADSFRELAEEIGVENDVRFLITGSVAVGKTTSVSQFRSLSTLDEWLEQRPSGMEKDPSMASPSELKKIDAFVAEQLALKNKRLLAAKDGIYVVDRAPLDLFAFEKDKSAWKEKAKTVLSSIRGNKAKRKLASCHVILLIGDPAILEVRAKANHRETSKAKLKEQQDLLIDVYQRNDGTISTVDTRNKTVAEVTKEIARIVHLNDFTETPLHKWLKVFSKNSKSTS